VRSIRRQHLKHDLIDFAASEPSGGLTFHEHLSAGPVTLAHASSRPVEGRHLAASQVIVAIHEGKAFDMDWRGAESDRVQSSTIFHGRAHVGDARLPFWVRYSASPSFFAFAMDEPFVAEIWQKAFDRPGDFAIQTSVGATFSAEAPFAGATFSSIAIFGIATFSGIANFAGATFSAANSPSGN